PRLHRPNTELVSAAQRGMRIRWTLYPVAEEAVGRPGSSATWRRGGDVCLGAGDASHLRGQPNRATGISDETAEVGGVARRWLRVPDLVAPEMVALRLNGRYGQYQCPASLGRKQAPPQRPHHPSSCDSPGATSRQVLLRPRCSLEPRPQAET